MGNILEYKGYRARIEHVPETASFRGIIEGINDYVDFETTDILQVEQEFHNAVDEYLKFCTNADKSPEKVNNKHNVNTPTALAVGVFS